MATVTAKETSTTTAPVVISKPMSSKINWINVVSGVVALLAAFGIIIPVEWQTMATQILAVITPILTVVLRSWFTGTKPPVG